MSPLESDDEKDKRLIDQKSAIVHQAILAETKELIRALDRDGTMKNNQEYHSLRDWSESNYNSLREWMRSRTESLESGIASALMVSKEAKDKVITECSGLTMELHDMHTKRGAQIVEDNNIRQATHEDVETIKRQTLAWKGMMKQIALLVAGLITTIIGTAIWDRVYPAKHTQEVVLDVESIRLLAAEVAKKLNQ